MSKAQKTPAAAAPPPQDAEEGFLRRWSRVKQESSAAAPVPAPPDAATAASPPDAPPLTDADMPPLDSLSEQSDLQPFLSSGVSDSLRRKAFRKIFLSERFNVRDGLDDYDEDFTEFAALGDVVTAEYRRWRERQAQRQQQEAQDDAAAPAETEATEAGQAAEKAESDTPARPDEQQTSDDHPRR